MASSGSEKLTILEIDRFGYCVFKSNMEFVGEGGEADVYNPHSEQLERYYFLGLAS